jgi:hypothetical protein
LLGALAYTFARIGAVVNLKVQDYYPTDRLRGGATRRHPEGLEKRVSDIIAGDRFNNRGSNSGNKRPY